MEASVAIRPLVTATGALVGDFNMVAQYPAKIAPPPVRRADYGDEEELMQMCRSLHQENGLFAMYEPKVRYYLRRAFDRQGAVIGVLGDRGKLEGSIYLLLSDYWYSEDLHLCELWSYVLPQYRKSSNAKELINFAKRCSDELKIPALIGIISNERTAPKIRLYERQLGTASGAFFLYNGRTPVPATVSQAQRAAG